MESCAPSPEHQGGGLAAVPVMGRMGMCPPGAAVVPHPLPVSRGRGEYPQIPYIY